MRYFLDSRNGDNFIQDDVGVKLATLDAARKLAKAGLADLAHDAIPNADRRELAVEVRDEAGRSVFRAALWFEAASLV